MKKSRKPLIITALCIIVAGLITCISVLAYIGFDFTKLDNSVFIESTYEFDEKITDIIIDTDRADIDIQPSEDNGTKLICFEDAEEKHKVTLQNGILSITETKREWYKYGAYLNLFRFRSPDITLCLPQSTYNSIRINTSTGDSVIDSINVKNIKIECSTGDITLNNLEAVDINLEASTGGIQLNNITAHNLEAETTTGDVKINHTVLSAIMDIETSTGDITFNYSDADTITAEASTGNITGTLLTPKTFFTDTSTGDVSVPYTTGNRCDLRTSTGNIRINIAE